MNKNFIFTLLFFINLSIFAEVRYVSKTGSSTAPYTTWETACDSLQKCFDYCNNGDTVYVDSGLYRETIILDNRVLTIIGIDADECIIDGTGLVGNDGYKVLFFQTRGKIEIKNITLKRKISINESYSTGYFTNLGELKMSNCLVDSTRDALAAIGPNNSTFLVHQDL